MKVPLFICGNQNLYSEECTLVIAIQNNKNNNKNKQTYGVWFIRVLRDI